MRKYKKATQCRTKGIGTSGDDFFFLGLEN